ncbi:uncharacterized protein [Palaemon carinicauda]|uniref:uncharacterized protein isoform X2 n=1 Tax=Palaemon carinicauda TaxID=392227 RepID=UPI0035B697DF
MRLRYYDDVTPSDYEPQGFATAASNDFQYEDESINIAAGEVSTRFHNVKVRVSVDKKHFYSEGRTDDENGVQEAEERESLEPNEEGIVRRYGYNLVSQTSDTSAAFSQLKCITDKEKDEVDDALRHSPTTKGRSSMNSNIPSNVNEDHTGQALENLDNNDILPQTPPSSSSYRVPEMSTQKTLDDPASYASTLYSNARTPTGQACTTPASMSSIRSVLVASPCVPDPEFPVRCPCGVHLDDGLMILCAGCGNWQHAVCFNVLEEEEAPSQHICELCADSSNPCTDPALPVEKDVTMICLYRRIIVYLRDYNGNVSVSMVSQRLGVDISIGKKIFTRLTSEKLLKKRYDAGGRVVNKECLAAFAFPGYLKRVMIKEDTLPGTPKCSSSVIQNLTPSSSANQPNDTDATPDLDMTTLQSSLKNVVTLKNLSEFGESQDVNVGTQAIQTELSSAFEQTETMSLCPDDEGRISNSASIAVDVQNSRNGKEMGNITPKMGKITNVYGKRRRKSLSRIAKKNHTYVNTDCY